MTCMGEIYIIYLVLWYVTTVVNDEKDRVFDPSCRDVFQRSQVTLISCQHQGEKKRRVRVRVRLRVRCKSKVSGSGVDTHQVLMDIPTFKDGVAISRIFNADVKAVYVCVREILKPHT